MASNTVTAVRVPDGVDGAALTKMMRTEYNTVLAGGQGELTGKIFRIGHLGLVTEADLTACLDALKLALPRVGYAPAGAARASPRHDLERWRATLRRGSLHSGTIGAAIVPFLIRSAMPRYPCDAMNPAKKILVADPIAQDGIDILRTEAEVDVAPA